LGVEIDGLVVAWMEAKESDGRVAGWDCPSLRNGLEVDL